MINPPKDAMACAGSIYLRSMTFLNKGDVEEGHAHTYDHFTMLVRGAVLIESNGRTSEYRADPFAIIFIPKSVTHRIIALEDNTVACCIHALHRLDDPGEILDESMIPAGTPPWSVSVSLIEADAIRQGVRIPPKLGE